MTQRRPYSLLFGGLAILATALILNHVQVQASTEKALTQAQVSQELVSARELKVSLERGMGLGKPLSLYSGADKLFQGLRAKDATIEYLAFTSPSLDLYAQSGPGLLDTLGPQEIPTFPAVNSGKDQNSYKTLVRENLVLVALPLYFNDRDLKGLAWLGFSRQTIADQVAVESAFGLNVLAISLSAALVIFPLLFFLLVRTQGTQAPRTERRVYLSLMTRVSLAIVSVLLVAILGYSVATTTRLTPLLVQAYQKNVEVLVKSQGVEWTKILDWGIAPDHWKGTETLLSTEIRHTPEAQILAVTDVNGRVLYRADRQGVYAVGQGGVEPAPLIPDQGWVRQPLAGSDLKPQAYLWSRVDQAFLDAIQVDRYLDALTVTVVSLIFSIELLLALGLFSHHRPRGALLEPQLDRGVKTVRFTAFLFFMSELLPLPFLPLFISDLYARAPLDLLGLSADAVKGLPFSAHLLGVMVFVPLVGMLTKKVDLRSLFLGSGALLLIGNLLAAFSGSLEVLIGCRFLSGLGYGGALAASAALVIQTVPKENRTSGFAAWGAGFAASSICAVILGGVLVTHLGYRNGLLVSALLSVALGLFVFFFHPHRKPEPEVDAPKTKLSDLLAPFRDRQAFLTLIFASIPVQIAFFGLFQYTLPLAMSEAGITEANIGRILTIYGLISLASPLVAKMADRRRNEKLLIVLGNGITGLALMLFFILSGVWPMIFVVAAIGIGGLLFDTVISSYLSQTKASQQLGEAPFLSAFLTWEKLITVFIPILVGTLMTSIGYLPSAAVLGIIILSGALLFQLLGPRRHP